MGETEIVWSDAYGYIEMPKMDNASLFSPYFFVPQPSNPTVISGHSDFDGYTYSMGSLEDIRITDTAKQTCPDCKGSKFYVGLMYREPCKNCNGTGEV